MLDSVLALQFLGLLLVILSIAGMVRTQSFARATEELEHSDL